MPRIDPDGLTARPTSGPGTVSSTACELGACGESHAHIDPNGLTARPVPAAPMAAFLAWLRALLAV